MDLVAETGSASAWLPNTARTARASAGSPEGVPVAWAFNMPMADVTRVQADPGVSVAALLATIAAADALESAAEAVIATSHMSGALDALLVDLDSARDAYREAKRESNDG